MLAVVGGCPLIVGARFPAAAARTVMRKLGSVDVDFPSETAIDRSPVTPTSACVGVPLTSPVVASICSHAGLPVTLNVSASPSASDAVGLKE